MAEHVEPRVEPASDQQWAEYRNHLAVFKAGMDACELPCGHNVLAGMAASCEHCYAFSAAESGLLDLAGEMDARLSGAEAILRQLASYPKILPELAPVQMAAREWFSARAKG